ncbi:hypothetical protein GCM10020218_057660 [Dactylosporangium vinaceum]
MTCPAFQDTLHRAIEGAEDGLLMTIGITPTHPETGYGYLHVGEPTGTGDVCKVAEFAEKPQLDVAQRYVDSGEYLWNAGMFVWRVDVFLDELARQQPELHEGLRRIAEAWDTHDREEILAQLWPSLTKISVDFGVMEGAGAAGLVGTVPGQLRLERRRRLPHPRRAARDRHPGQRGGRAGRAHRRPVLRGQADGPHAGRGARGRRPALGPAGGRGGRQ